MPPAPNTPADCTPLTDAHTWTLDNRIVQAERKAMQDGFAFQKQRTPEYLHKYQLAIDDRVMTGLHYNVLTKQIQATGPYVPGNPFLQLYNLCLHLGYMR